MPQTVYKYPIEAVANFSMELPSRAKILHFGEHKGNLFVWALVDTDAPMDLRTFRLAGTGHPISTGERLEYIGTTTNHQDMFVWHLFEIC